MPDESTRSPKPTKRLTVDLATRFHREVKSWATDNETELSTVTRVLLTFLLEDPELAARVRRELR